MIIKQESLCLEPDTLRVDNGLYGCDCFGLRAELCCLLTVIHPGEKILLENKPALDQCEETHLLNQLTQGVSCGSGRAERRFTMAWSASLLNLAFSGTLTALLAGWLLNSSELGQT